MAAISLTLLVLKTHQVDRLRAFYQAIGLEFVEEQHGAGPRHHAGRVGEVVLEIYPLPNDSVVDASIRLGFSVRDLAAVVQSLQAIGTVVVKQPTATAWGLLAIVKDPDGRPIELSQP